MTEIKIEKKKLAWPWIIFSLILIAVLIYFVAFHNFDENTDEIYNSTEQISTVETSLIDVKENNSTVAAYVDFIEKDENKMSLDHEFTNAALLKLTNAADAMADEVGYSVRADLEKVKVHAESIIQEPFETTHANSIRNASDIIANALHNIQKAKYPGLKNEAEGLRNASESIDPNVLTLDQRNEVKDFFSKAAVLLKKMN